MIPTAADTTAGLWDSATVSTVINDPDPRRVHVQSIMSLIQPHGFDGIQIDYEDLPADDRDCFSAFVTDLGQAGHQAGKVLYITVHVKMLLVLPSGGAVWLLRSPRKATASVLYAPGRVRPVVVQVI